MDKPASTPDELPPPERPRPEDEPIPEGTNETIHRPDPRADEHRARPGEKVRGPYVTGNT